MNKEKERLQQKDWKKWGPYVTARQWGTVREDYSEDGRAWEYTTHDTARSKAWRWGEEGIGGISDDQQLLCFAPAFWNKKDPIIKERFFGLSGNEGNHGEDVKELYYYLDNTPTHSYMRMLYKYPQQTFPYDQLVAENRRRSRHEPEFELMDTGIFNNNEYFDVFIEYAKAEQEDLLIRLTVHNRGKDTATLHVLPTIWFRNTWSWGFEDREQPFMTLTAKESIHIGHKKLGNYHFYCDGDPEILFTDNETNYPRLFNFNDGKHFYKDGINDYLVHGHTHAVNEGKNGTKVAANYEMTIAGGGSRTIRLRLVKNEIEDPFATFDAIFTARQEETDIFYKELQSCVLQEDEQLVQRQAFAGLLWNKQFYYYYVDQWLKGDPGQPTPPARRLHGRNTDWKHLINEDIISMPDKWEYPWYAAWDLAFHCLPLAIVDAGFAKEQLSLLTKEWYMHPSGELPAYEWAFSDVNPPVHAWAAWRVFQVDREQNGKEDVPFLEAIFHKLLLNFTWWVNRKDAAGNNIFEGGFLGLDNIGIFDRTAPLPNGNYIEQADGTSWMAMYCLNMLRISLELAKHNKVYADMATKFFEHFLYIASAINLMGEKDHGLWDDEDGFFYDQLRMVNDGVRRIRVRSMVGLIPLFAVTVLDEEIFQAQPEFTERLNWFLNFRPDLASLVSRWFEIKSGRKHLLSLLRGHRMKRILRRMLDETEFLSDYGIRSLSKYHEQHPCEHWMDGQYFRVEYTPGESNTAMFGGNSNWRGPVWMPVNYLIVESLRHFHHYYGDDFKVEYPTNSGVYLTLKEISNELSKRITRLFLRNEQGKRPVFGNYEQMQQDPHFRDYILFYEYFHGDNGRGFGAAHQTGWTALVVKLLGR